MLKLYPYCEFVNYKMWSQIFKCSDAEVRVYYKIVKVILFMFLLICYAKLVVICIFHSPIWICFSIFNFLSCLFNITITNEFAWIYTVMLLTKVYHNMLVRLRWKWDVSLRIYTMKLFIYENILVIVVLDHKM